LTEEAKKFLVQAKLEANQTTPSIQFTVNVGTKTKEDKASISLPTTL
jgi:hypothetical protein